MRRHIKLIQWSIAIALGVLVALAIAVKVASRTTVLRQALVKTLNDNLDAEVDLDGFEVNTFPRLRIHGDGLRLRLKGQKNPAPFIEVRHFEVSGGLFGMLKKQRTFSSVDLEGLRITIPPRSPHDKESGNEAASAMGGRVLIDHITARDAALIIMPKDPAKEPKVWAIHDLDLESVGFDRSMPFTATLSNPIPKGEIATTGTFGPWNAPNPGGTPLGGKYSFQRADLGTIKGIGGILSSTGTFDGILERIGVKGKTSTPDFSIDSANSPVPLETTFDAVVDGTNGNTYLNKVSAMLGKTPIETSGEISSQPHVKGRTVKLDMKIADGRLEDVLHLAMRKGTPVMTGAIALQAKLLLPPEDVPVIQRLHLDGTFALEHVAFTNAKVREQLVGLSRHAQGKKEGEPVGPISSEMRGRFDMGGGQLRLHPVSFSLPGAIVQLTGGYGMRSESLDFTGTLSLDATVSQAMGGGVKGFFLKPFDPIFRKDGKGTVVPITISGPREQPKFGVQWSKVIKQ